MKILAAIALFAACTAHAGDTRPVHGTWTGKIGNSEINACFTRYDSHYYYLKHQHGIQLAVAEESSNTWVEQAKNPKTNKFETTGTWEISRIDDGRLEGTWKGTGKSKQQHIALTRSAPANSDQCGVPYYGALVNWTNYKFGNSKLGALSIRTANAPIGSSFELLGDSPAIRAINTYAKRWREEQVQNAFHCELNGGGGWESSLTPERIVGNYLLVGDNEQDNFCGGAHGNSAHSTAIFDLRDGAMVDGYAWLTVSKKDLAVAGEDEPKHPLRELIEEFNPREDCTKEYGTYFEIGAPYPRSTGIVFPSRYPHATRACDDEIEISFARLAPYLNKEGKALARSLKGKL